MLVRLDLDLDLKVLCIVLNRFARAFRSLYYAIAFHSLSNRYEIVSQSLRNRYAISTHIMQSLCIRLAIALHSFSNRFAFV
jgi:hypothetical protein